ncbi:hypothetical protein FIBSPDRAFT_760125, partial [Athelia psychrophila]
MSTTVLPYTCLLLPSVLALYHPHAKIKPFRQRIQLLGPKDYAVRSTAQVDNGAMRNCIGLHIWNAYGICLGNLTPTTTSVTVANNQAVHCVGTWSGTVRIGGTESHTHFLVFDCGRAFDIILGKPWLHEVRGVHDYRTDVIEIEGDHKS